MRYTLLIFLTLLGTSSNAQFDHFSLKSYFNKYVQINCGFYQINYKYKPLTSSDTISLSAKVYVRNDLKTKDISKINFCVEFNDKIYFTNTIDSFYRFDSKANCLETHASSTFEFESLQGTSTWRVFNRLFITGQYINMINDEITNCVLVKNPLDEFTSVRVDYTPSEDIKNRFKLVGSKKIDSVLYYREENYLEYLELFQFDISEIKYYEIPLKAYEDSINSKLNRNCRFFFNRSAVIENENITNIDSSYSTFSLPNLEDSTIDLSKISSRFILLDFWYKGCIPCLKSIPILNKLKSSFSENDLAIFGINPYDYNFSELKKIKEQRSILYSILIDKGKVIAERYSISAFPTVLLIDNKKKKIILRKEGFATEEKDELYEKIKLILMQD